MSIFKKLNKQDAIIVPYISNKTYLIATDSSSASIFKSTQYMPDSYYYFNGSSSLCTKLYKGTNLSGSLFEPSSDPIYNGEYKRLIYDSIKHLYYSNFISSSIEESGSYINYNQSTLTQNRYFPTSSGSEICVLSVNKEYVGEKILPKTFLYSSSLINLSDDGEGNICDITGSYVGNIFYPHGVLVFTKNQYFGIFTSSFAMSYKGEHTIYETQYRCTINESEFNYTLNPSIQSDNSGSIYSYATASYFTPYVTAIGLYNEANELLAVGKLSQPTCISSRTDMTFVLNLDK